MCVGVFCVFAYYLFVHTKLVLMIWLGCFVSEPRHGGERKTEMEGERDRDRQTNRRTDGEHVWTLHCVYFLTVWVCLCECLCLCSCMLCI